MIAVILCMLLITPGLETWVWQEAAGDVDHYNVYLSENGSEFILAGTAKTPSFTINCTPGNSYQFKVEAVDAAGNVGPMSEVSDIYWHIVVDSLKPAIHGGK